jgi:hypothetical protein
VFAVFGRETSPMWRVAGCVSRAWPGNVPRQGGRGVYVAFGSETSPMAPQIESHRVSGRDSGREPSRLRSRAAESSALAGSVFPRLRCPGEPASSHP